MRASYNGRTDIVRELTAADDSVEHVGMQSNMRDIDGEKLPTTALHFAGQEGHLGVARLLVKAGGVELVMAGDFVNQSRCRSPSPSTYQRRRGQTCLGLRES